MTKLLIPIEKDKGLDSEIVEHFGRAKYFLFVTLEDAKVSAFYVKKNSHSKQDVQAGLLVSKSVLDEDVTAILTKEIGEISFHMLRDNFIEMYLVETNKAKQAIDDFTENKLEKLEEATHLSNK